MALWLAGKCGEHKDRWIMSGDSWYRNAVRSTANELQNFGSLKGTDITSQAVPVLAVLPSCGQTPHYSFSVFVFLCLQHRTSPFMQSWGEKSVNSEKKGNPDFLVRILTIFAFLRGGRQAELSCVAYLYTFCTSSLYPPLRNLSFNW